MATWKEMSIDNLSAAQQLFQVGRYRSCISRAYYAAYCAATNEILSMKKTFGRDRKNPPHDDVPKFLKEIKSNSKYEIQQINKLFIELKKF